MSAKSQRARASRPEDEKESIRARKGAERKGTRHQRGARATRVHDVRSGAQPEPTDSPEVHAGVGARTVLTSPQETAQMALAPTWQWLTSVWEHVDGDWLGQEMFDIMKHANVHGDIESVVRCQAGILANICPTGTPTRECWLWSWRLANDAANDHRLMTHVRRMRGSVAAHG